MFKHSIRYFLQEDMDRTSSMRARVTAIGLASLTTCSRFLFPSERCCVDDFGYLLDKSTTRRATGGSHLTRVGTESIAAGTTIRVH